jgi:hypothetical protein
MRASTLTNGRHCRSGGTPSGRETSNSVAAATRSGLSEALRSAGPSLAKLHALVLDELIPACTSLLVAGQEAGEVDRELVAFTLLRAVGNLSVPGPGYGTEEARQMVTRLLAGCRTPAGS